MTKEYDANKARWDRAFATHDRREMQFCDEEASRIKEAIYEVLRKRRF